MSPASPDSTSLRAGAITVVLPNRNHGRYLGAALEAICTQSRTPLFVVAIDDASQDNSREIIASFVRRYPFVMQVDNQASRGTVANNNEWIDRAQTEYIYLAAADDLVLPGFFEKSASALDAFPQAAFANTATAEIDDTGNRLPAPKSMAPVSTDFYLSPSQVLRRLMQQGSFCAGNTSLYRTALLREAGGFPNEFSGFADGYLMQELALRRGCVFIPEVLGVWRRNASGNAGSLGQSVARLNDVLVRVVARMQLAGQDIFPAPYIARFAKRWRHSAAVNFLQTGSVDAATKVAELDGIEAAAFEWICRSFGCQWGAYYLLLRLSPHELPSILRAKLR